MRRGEAGFTLIESIVAIAVFAAMTAMLYESMSGNWRGWRRGQSDVMALALAKTTLATAGLETPLAAGQQYSGTEGGIAWQLTVEDYVPPGDQSNAAILPPAFWLNFAASWSDGRGSRRRRLELRSLKLGDPP